MSSDLFIAAGDYAVFGVNGSSSNGGYTADYVYSSAYQLGNGADEVVLTEPSGVEIDAVEYVDTGSHPFPDVAGKSLTFNPLYLDTALYIPADENDSYARWCAGTTAFGTGDKGTPGGANDSCP